MSKIVNLSHQHTQPSQNLAKKTDYEQNFSAPFLVSSDSDDFSEDIKTLRNFRENFILSSSKSAPITSVNMAFQRGIALITPYLCPTKEHYEGQHEESFHLFKKRLENAKLCEDEFGYITPEVFTLIAIGSEFCNPKDPIFKEIEQHLTKEEKIYIETINNAYKTGHLDDEYPYAHVMFYHMHEELLETKKMMLDGQLHMPCIEQQGRILTGLMASYDEGTPADTIEHELCTLLKEIEVLRYRKDEDYDSEIYDFLEEDGFDSEKLETTLQLLNVPTNHTIINLIDRVIENLEIFPQSRTKEPFEIFKERTLSPLIKFLEYYPDADEDVVLYALVEAHLPYSKIGFLSQNDQALAGEMHETLKEFFPPETVKRFQQWNKTLNDQNRWKHEPEYIQEQLESLCACIVLVQNFEINKNLQLGYQKNLLIADDISDADIMLEAFQAINLKNKDLADEFHTELEQIGLNITDAFSEPIIDENIHELSDIADRIQPESHLTLVTPDYKPEG